jgi:hypothetical protein
VCLCVGWLEGHSFLLSRLLERNTKLEELHNNISEVVEEGLVVLGVLLNVGSERLVLDQSHVGRKHHQGLGLLVLVL